MKLVEPIKIDENTFNSFIKEFTLSGEDLVPYSLNQKGKEFKKYIETLNDEAVGKGIPENWVPASTYFLIDDENNIYGAVNIRHRLTENLKIIGGHVGFGIKPSVRHKGYGTKILELALSKCKDMGITKVLVTCNKENIGSMKVIQNNGGKLDSEADIDEELIQRYWIVL